MAAWPLPLSWQLVARHTQLARALCTGSTLAHYSGTATCGQRRCLSSSACSQAAQALQQEAAGAHLVQDPALIRDFAIIAHIDHGKTTLMDRLLSASGASINSDRVMDSNSLERERGITILSKYTSFAYKGHLINAVDTPGHADFGGEVERVMGMVDGAVLLVDAAEGPLAQTKAVMAKAVARGLAPIVVLNKVDKEAVSPERCGQVASEIFDLLAQLGATDEQLDFPLLYASAKQGWASTTLPPPGTVPPNASMAPLLDAIVRHVPPPNVSVEDPFSMCVAMIERDPFVGRIATGRIASGSVRVGDRVRVLQYDQQRQNSNAHASSSSSNPAPGSASSSGGAPSAVFDDLRVTRLTKRCGVETVHIEEAVAGDVVSLAGAMQAGIADTIASPCRQEPLDPGHIDPPTLSMVFAANDSPLAGRSGKAVTGRVIGERLAAEAETSVSLRVRPVSDGVEKYEVQARGELQLGILVENMRREGLELSVSPPQVLLRQEGGRQLEPIEEVSCEVSDEQAGAIIEAVSLRKGELQAMVPLSNGRQRLVFEVPSRGMIGFKTSFAGLTRGEGLLNRAFARYGDYKGPMPGVRKGVLVAMADGRSTMYALNDLQARGTFLIGVGEEVYAGMLIGEHTREEDIDVNPVREKKLTNVRSVSADEKMHLPPPRQLTLEEAIGFVAADELIEVTPGRVRLRKAILDANQRRLKAKAAAGGKK